MNQEYIIDDSKIYFNNVGRKSFQWELWQYCNSLCKFCYLGKDNRVNNKERQLVSLNDLNKAIDELNYNEYNNISLIGGEFFQGQLDDPEVHDLFFEIIKKMFKRYQEKYIGSMWITCTLTIGDQKHLYELLDLAQEMNVFPVKEYTASGLWLCTSWDSLGRFHNDKMKDNWEFHMKNIKEKYPWIKFNTTIILQQKFIEDYLSGEFNLKNFKEEFSTTVFFKQCGIPPFSFLELGIENTNELLKDSNKNDPLDQLLLDIKDVAKRKVQDVLGFQFFPSRKDFLKFLIKFNYNDKADFDRLFNIKYRSDELHRNFLEEEHDTVNIRQKAEIGPEENGVKILPCGHTESYAAYIDSPACCICDRNMIADK